MMNISVILIVAGIFMAFIYPMIKTKVSDAELATAHVYERGDDRGWMSKRIDLNTINNPAKLKLTAMFLPGTPYMEKGVRFNVQIIGQKGIVQDKTVRISLGKYTAASDGSVTVFTYIPQFSISRSGDYIIRVSMDEKPDFSLSSVYITVLSSAVEPDASLRTPGIIALVFGMVLFVRARKRKRKQSSNPTKSKTPKIETPKPAEKPVKKKIRWGRNADLD